MTKYNDEAATPEEAIVTAFEELAPRLYMGPKAASEAANLMYETAEVAGPGGFQRLVNSFRKMHRHARSRDPDGFVKYNTDPHRARMIREEIGTEAQASAHGVRVFETETVLEWLELSGTDQDLRCALGHILRLLRQGTRYEAAVESYGLRGHTYFAEFWPVQMPDDRDRDAQTKASPRDET